MTNVSLTQNFARVIKHLQDEGIGATNIAKMMGYTSTSQLNNSLEEKSMLSTKAILTMIERVNVNPIYLFLGKGEMFLTDDEETDFTKLYNQFNKLFLEHKESLETIKKLTERNMELEKMCSDLLSNTASLVKYYQEKSHDVEENENNKNQQDI